MHTASVIISFPEAVVKTSPKSDQCFQKFKQGGLSDARVFDLNDGLKWTDPAKRIRVEVDLDQWIGKRASSGRTVPRGFPKQNKFN